MKASVIIIVASVLVVLAVGLSLVLASDEPPAIEPTYNAISVPAYGLTATLQPDIVFVPIWATPTPHIYYGELPVNTPVTQPTITPTNYPLFLLTVEG